MAKTFEDWDEDELREALIAQYADDLRVLRERGYFHPPWTNIDYIAKNDHFKLMTAIADHAGIEFDPEYIRDLMGMKATANAMAVVNGAVKADLIERRDDYLMLTFYGRDVLEHVEEHGNF